MKKTLLPILLLLAFPVLLAGQIGIYRHGSVVRMHMGDCLLAHHGFAVAFGGPQTPEAQESCPEYTLVTSDVVYIIVGKSSNHLIPLAENIDFRFQKNEIAVRVDDAKHETRFAIKEMVVRQEWDRLQRHVEEQIRAAEDRPMIES